MCAIVALLVAAMTPLSAGAWSKKIDEFPDLGALTPNPNSPAWSTQKARLHNLKPMIFDFFSESYYHTSTTHVTDAVNEGAWVVIIRSPAVHESLRNNSTCNYTPDQAS